MRVLHLSRTMGQGGAEKIVYQLCKDNCADLNIVASCGGEYVKQLEENGVKHIDIPDMENKNLACIFKTLGILIDVMKKYDITIIHSHHRMGAFYARILQSLFSKIHHVYTAHNVFYDKKRLMRYALSKAKIVACGSTVKTNLLDVYEIDETKIKVIYNAVEVPECETIKFNESRSEESIDIGLIGRLSEQKGVDIFIKSISKLYKKYPKIRIYIIGDGEDRNKIENLVDELKLNEYVNFLGFRTDIFNLIKSMNFIVLPSRWEGFPLTPIEVFSMKKTIIVSDIPNNTEIVEDGYNGLVFKSEDVGDLSKKIEELILMDKSNLENNAYNTYCEKFSYNQFINNYNSIYKELLE